MAHSECAIRDIINSSHNITEFDPMEDDIKDIVIPMLRSIQREVSRNSERLDNITQRMQSLESTTTHLSDRIDGLSVRVDRFDTRLARVEGLIDHVNIPGAA
jgi:chromosome segregation ATPase